MQNTCAVVLLSLVPLVTLGVEQEATHTAFLLGLKVGQIDLHEAKILEAYTMIQLLEGMKGEKIQNVVTLKRQQINVDLLSLSRYLDETKGATNWPAEVRAIAGIKASNVRTAMRSLRRARREAGWEERDVPKEEAIQEVFDVYEEFGNLLRIKTK